METFFSLFSVPPSWGKDFGGIGEAAGGKSRSEALEREHSCSPSYSPIGKCVIIDKRRKISVHLTKARCYITGFRVVSLSSH